MKIRLLAGAACAALTILGAPVSAASNPKIPAQRSAVTESADQAVSAFYAARHGAPLWLRGGAEDASALITTLQRASLDGFQSGPALAAEAQVLINRARAGDTAALTNAERLLSTAWVLYVQTLQTPPPGRIYADSWVTPRRETPAQILARASAARSLATHVREVANVNPLYAQLRDVAWAEMQSAGGNLDPRVLTSLERVRDMPAQDRYVMVDTAGARLYMIENGRIADSMKVIVGKADPKMQTPMLASTIYYATLNPYWHVTPELVRSLIAKNVLEQGFDYLKVRGYQVKSADGDLLDPADVDWRAVAAGTQTVRVRQLPGPANSMGKMKVGFPNAMDIYLHDTPVKDLFGQDDRSLSHGCVRLEDAQKLERWLLQGEPQIASSEPEQNVLLPTPVPIYMTYLTAQARDGRLTYVDDVYGHDAQRLQQVAALR